ncbi:MAG: DNA polymerase IV [Spirochaetia bacterium]|nr:DNA polymerase IV [Spirochaetia bacterium]
MKAISSDQLIFHVDMDAFYASVEQADNPEYLGKPVIIGASPGHRGVVAACSYEARKFGIHSAMPISQAYARCRDGIYLPVRMKRYQEVSRTIMAAFNDFTPDVIQISVDEAFLNMTGTEKLFGTPVETGHKIKARIKIDTDLNISVGIAHNKFLAKLASEYKKPNGLYIVQKGKEIEFIDSLKLGDLWGLGKKTLERLENYNIFTPGDLRSIDQSQLENLLGSSSGDFLYKIVRGIDPGMYTGEIKNRSVSNEITFGEDTKDAEVLKLTLLELSYKVMFRVLEAEEKGRTVQLKLRYSDFTTITVRETHNSVINSAEELFDIANKLFHKKWKKSETIRLIGLGLSSLEDINTRGQIELFEDSYEQSKKVEKVALEIRRKGNKLTKASLLNRNIRNS